MGKQRVLLEQIADPALLRRQKDTAVAVEPHLIAQADMAALGPFEAGQTSQRCRLAGPGWAEQHGHRGGAGRAPQIRPDQWSGRKLLFEFSDQLDRQIAASFFGGREVTERARNETPSRR